MSEMAGFGAGFVGGLVVARGVGREKPAAGRAAWVMAAASVIVVLAAVPLVGIIDFRPEVARITAVEERTASAYDNAVANFRLGRIPAKGLIQLIDRTIIPELEAVRARVAGLRGVPQEQVPLVAAAQEYVQLRQASWRRRAEGLLKSNTNILRDAEVTERAALDAFRKMDPPPRVALRSPTGRPGATMRRNWRTHELHRRAFRPPPGTRDWRPSSAPAHRGERPVRIGVIGTGGRSRAGGLVETAPGATSSPSATSEPRLLQAAEIAGATPRTTTTAGSSTIARSMRRDCCPITGTRRSRSTRWPPAGVRRSRSRTPSRKARRW
jgi:hypothetical protein